jgi:hypothetical protein
MQNLVNENARPHDPFYEGDDVVLAEGTYQGTHGVFVHLRADPNWADIKERNGIVREHPVAWLARAAHRPGPGVTYAPEPFVDRRSGNGDAL